MKTLILAFLRTTFLGFTFLALFKSKMVLAEPSVAELPVVTIADLNFSVKAPSGWKVRQNYRGKTLVLEDPMSSNHGDSIYNRNITIAVQSGAKPIDALEIERVSQKLKEDYAKSVSNFQIIESRIIDYRSKGDAILLFSSFEVGKVSMRQMHIYTSGSEHTVLLSFTDLEDSFEIDGALNRAWTTMMSAEIAGVAPHRYDGLMYSGTGLALLVTAAFFSKQLRRRYQKEALRAEENALFAFDEHDENNDDDDEFALNFAPRTKLASEEVEDWQLAETRYAGQIA